MLLAIIRDTGLLLFLAGGVVLFALGKIHLEKSHVALASWIGNIADGMMLGGAALAVVAMLIGFVLSGPETTPLTSP
jgi:hypothetical protein